MCNYFSCIITRDLKVHYSKKTCSHEDLINELKLQDIKLVDRDFVRIEITPKNPGNYTRNSQDWNFKVDEEDTIPSWYSENKTKSEEAIWIAWKESVQNQLILEAESVDVTDTYLFVRSSSTVVARGSSKVEAWGSSTVEAWGSSKVEAWGSSTVEISSGSAVAICHGKILVNKKATVIVKESFSATEIDY
jgi:hypothetical protein